MTNTQTLTAETFGMINYENGIMRAAAQSKELMNMLEDNKVGQSNSSELMAAWYKGWDKAKRIEMKERFGF